MDPVGFVALAGLVLLGTAFVAALVDIARLPAPAFRAVGRLKGAMAVLVLLSGGVGGLYWLLVVRRSVVQYRWTHVTVSVWQDDPFTYDGLLS
jgi:hypothetical protein